MFIRFEVLREETGSGMDVYLETERLVLRQFTPRDVDNLWALDSDLEVTRYLTGGQATPYEVIRDEEIPFFLAYYKKGDRLGWWAAEEKVTRTFIGWFHLKPDRFDDAALEIGYRLRRPSWGKGYATEAAKALVRKAFEELGATRVTAYTSPENKTSWRVMEKVGLGFVRKFVWEAPGRWRHGKEAVEYALTSREWRSSGNAEQNGVRRSRWELKLIAVSGQLRPYEASLGSRR